MQSIAVFQKNITFVTTNKLLKMKNLKKLAKSELRKINGGNAPSCEGGQIACRHKAEDGFPAYWSCEPAELGCRF